MLQRNYPSVLFDNNNMGKTYEFISEERSDGDCLDRVCVCFDSRSVLPVRLLHLERILFDDGRNLPDIGTIYSLKFHTNGSEAAQEAVYDLFRLSAETVPLKVGEVNQSDVDLETPENDGTLSDS